MNNELFENWTQASMDLMTEIKLKYDDGVATESEMKFYVAFAKYIEDVASDLD